MIKAECDRCGKQAETKDTTVAAPSPLPIFRKVQLPDEWHRTPYPHEDGSAWEKILCPGCVNALRRFFEGDGAVPGLLEPETLAAHCENCGHAPHGHGEHLTDMSALKDCPDCSCAAELREMNDGIPPADAVTLAREKHHPRRPHDFVGDEDTCVADPDCPVTWREFAAWRKGEDLRPNLTARAEKIATGNIPVGQAEAPCPNGGDGLCNGRYRRGGLHEHMANAHGIKVSERSVQCPYCVEIQPRVNVGAHIAAEHPGDWQAWIDGGQHAD